MSLTLKIIFTFRTLFSLMILNRSLLTTQSTGSTESTLRSRRRNRFSPHLLQSKKYWIFCKSLIKAHAALNKWTLFIDCFNFWKSLTVTWWWRSTLLRNSRRNTLDLSFWFICSDKLESTISSPSSLEMTGTEATIARITPWWKLKRRIPNPYKPWPRLITSSVFTPSTRLWGERKMLRIITTPNLSDS